MRRVGVLLLTVENVPAMSRWYQGVLGLRPTDVHPGTGYEPGVNWTQLALDEGPVLELFDRSLSVDTLEAPFPRRNAVVIAFEVSDFAAEKLRLEDNGVTWTEVGDEGWGRAAHFLDPEGNALQIFHVADLPSP